MSQRTQPRPEFSLDKLRQSTQQLKNANDTLESKLKSIPGQTSTTDQQHRFEEYWSVLGGCFKGKMT